MKRWLKNNSLSLVMFGLFFVFLVSQSVTGYWHFNEEQQTHHEPAVTYTTYVRSGNFIESVFENWESEFLQMGMYVILTVFLFQQGSAESKKIHGGANSDRKPRKSLSKDAPWPVRQGGWILRIYENSLSIAFLALFLLSFWLHAYGGARTTCEQNLEHGQRECPSTLSYMGTSKFWFESFQNWQSEFLAVASIVILSVYFRQKGSPESKPVNTPHALTGSE
jgi:hypothetical protein